MIEVQKTIEAFIDESFFYQTLSYNLTETFFSHVQLMEAGTIWSTFLDGSFNLFIWKMVYFN